MEGYEYSLHKLINLIPEKQIEEILSQKFCELDPGFLGFVEQYDHLSQIIPKHFVVIDFGCYLSAQCWFFKDHKQYIGVSEKSIGNEEMKRFEAENSINIVSSIQDYIAKNKNHTESTFAICNYVPDDQARKLVRDTYNNVFCFYPSFDNTFSWE